jgi:hypothetical protein
MDVPVRSARTTCLLGPAILSFIAIALIALEVRRHRITPILGLALAGPGSVVDVSSTGAVATSALIVGSIVIGPAIWAVKTAPLPLDHER